MILYKKKEKMSDNLTHLAYIKNIKYEDFEDSVLCTFDIDDLVETLEDYLGYQLLKHTGHKSYTVSNKSNNIIRIYARSNDNYTEEYDVRIIHLNCFRGEDVEYRIITTFTSEQKLFLRKKGFKWNQELDHWSDNDTMVVSYITKDGYYRVNINTGSEVGFQVYDFYEVELLINAYKEAKK